MEKEDRAAALSRRRTPMSPQRRAEITEELASNPASFEADGRESTRMGRQTAPSRGVAAASNNTANPRSLPGPHPFSYLAAASSALILRMHFWFARAILSRMPIRVGV